MRKHHFRGMVTLLLTGLLTPATAGPTRARVSPDLALIRAVNGNQLSDVQVILRHGASVNAKDKYGQTALMWAAEDQEVEIVRLLLDAGANPNAKDKDGLTALMWCAAGPAMGAAMNIMDDRNTSDVDNEPPAQTILSGDDSATAAARSCQVAEMLLARKANIHARSADGTDALNFAAGSTQLEPDLVRLLLRRGGNAKTRDSEGETALMSALAAGDSPQTTQILALLLDAGADANAQKTSGSHVGLTALMWAATEAHSSDDVRLLLAHGANVNLRQPDGWTALMAAAEFGTPGSVRMLLDRGADPTAKNAQGDTPLSLAAGTRRDKSVIALLQNAGVAR